MEFLVGGLAACGAGLFTNPLEVVKTRIQLQGELQARGHYTVHYRNVFHAFYAIAKHDGIRTLQSGLAPALWYQFFMNGTRLGAYHVMEDMNLTKKNDGSLSVPKSIAAGATAGCIGAFIGSPLYQVKVQLQAQSSAPIAVGYQHKHEGTLSAFLRIYRENGVHGLWRGSTAALLRVSSGSAVQLSTFSKSKALINEFPIFREHTWLNALVASSISGVVVVATMTPFDVCCTRLYNQPTDPRGKGLLYTGIVDCFLKIFRTEGFMGFYKGVTASFLRLGPHTVLSLVFWSELRKEYALFIQHKEVEAA
ncbi:solute carrier family 25 member 35-like [Ornithodoros turicata]|uniref:solute carrier family 25 member 35-like n=1 Tax=Ornithodoros turicata TaxID=34597 RepID=UPI0031395C76